jgi:Ras-related protein Rab-11A
MEETNEMLFKIILIGDAATGKTNILSQFINNKFELESKATIGVELSCKTFMINNDKVNAQIWDTAGQERYKSLTKAYFKGALGALVVYDITSKKTFENADKWISDLKNSSDKNISIILLGNKSDLEDKRQVSKEEGEIKAKNMGMAFLETSALNGNNIELAFKTLIDEVYDKYHKEFESEADIEIIRGKTISVEETKKKSKKCCDKDSLPLIKEIREKRNKK